MWIQINYILYLYNILYQYVGYFYIFNTNIYIFVNHHYEINVYLKCISIHSLVVSYVILYLVANWSESW